MVEIIKVDSEKLDKKTIKKAVEILENDGIVIYPTDSLYGLAGNALSEKAIKRVFEIKGRNYNKPLSIAFNNLAQAKKYVKFNRLSMKLFKKFLPGPLTMILKMKYNFSEMLTCGSEKVGIRVPDNYVARMLAKKFPIIATSANLSGDKDPVTAKEAISQIGNKVDLVLDGGKCKYSKPSTVVDVSSDKIEIVREGAISEEELLSKKIDNSVHN